MKPTKFRLTGRLTFYPKFGPGLGITLPAESIIDIALPDDASDISKFKEYILDRYLSQRSSTCEPIPERFRPEVDDIYYYSCHSITSVSLWKDTNADKRRWEVGNCFATEADAELALKALNAKEVFMSVHEKIADREQGGEG